MEEPEPARRSLAFTNASEPRFWWHRLPGSDFVPPIYATLTDDEWRVLEAWYAATSREKLIGECAVPLISLLQGIVMGSIVRRIVQLGTYAGYSALLLGFCLRKMNAPRALFALDIEESLCRYARSWIERAELESFVRIEHGSSLDAGSPGLARDYLGGAPELVFIDASHEYGSTRAELALWYPELAPGGLVVLHDTSEFAVGFDVTREGGVRRALEEWRRDHPGVESMSLNADARSMGPPHAAYKDFCGVGLIRKPLAKG